MPRPMVNGTMGQAIPPQGPPPSGMCLMVSTYVSMTLIVIILVNGPTPQQQIPPNQRPNMPVQRPPNGAPYPSPVGVPNSPHHPPNARGTPQQPVGSGTALTSMNSRMPPPNGPTVPNAGAQQTPQPAFQPLASASSQPGSPAQPGNMTAPSPSLASRQPPAAEAADHQLNTELGLLNKDVLASLKQSLGFANKDLPSLNAAEKVSRF